MDEIEADIQTKSIERVKSVVIDEPVKPKPKKERTQAQKEAFEKARLKRAENLARKKKEAQETLTNEYDDNEDIASQTCPQPEPQVVKPAPKRRGRPRKKKVQEQPAEHFIPPTQGFPSQVYPTQEQARMMMFNPYAMYPPQQHQPQQQPVVNNYYYGTNPIENKTETIREKVAELPQPPPQEIESSSEEEYELPIDPRMKFRFA